jgi:sirohydrochlorin cobaltochelatase
MRDVSTPIRLHLPAGFAPADKTGILLVAYGSPGAAAQQAPDFFESLVKRTCPSLPVYRAFTSESRHSRSAGGGRDSVYRALLRMSAECCARVAVQSLHLVPGREYRAMTEEIAEASKAGGPRHVRIGAPLLHSEEDACVSIHSRLHPPTDSVPADRSRVDYPLPEGRGCRESMPGFAGRQVGISLKGEASDHKGIFGEVAAALTASLGEERDPKEFVVWVGHGGDAADDVYARLAAAAGAQDRWMLLGTLAGEKGVENIIEDLRALCDGCVGRVRLIPLLAAVGKHAAEDIAGAEAHSWRGRLAAAGFDCRVELKGLAEREEFARIWLARLTVALDGLAGR